MSEPHLVRYGLEHGTVDYVDAWDEQRRLHAQRVADTIPDTVLLLEHSAVYTAGKRTEPAERPADGTPVVDVDRGGKITWHGPGQLVGYPIVRLSDPIDVVAYVRLLETILIDVCAELGVATTRIDGRSGVWVPADATGPARKVGAIGIRVAQGVTMHGFALNCDCALDWSTQIVPCGISDAGVTSITHEAGRTVTVRDALPVVERHLRGGLAVYSSAGYSAGTEATGSAADAVNVSPGLRNGTSANATACA